MRPQRACRPAVVGALLCATAALPRGEALAAPKPSWAATNLPNVELVDQDGNRVRFYDDLVKGRVVLVNFIFATCTGPCPLETAKLRQVQEELGDRVGRDIFMYSISIDPANDTPAVLKAYAEKFKVKPGWRFLTGNEVEINELRRKLGLFAGEERTDHSVNLVVGNDATGQWLKRSSFDHPKVLAAVLGERLFNYARPASGAKSYAQAPKLRFDAGEDLFRRRCQACHTVGGGDTVGPDLVWVTRRRSREWLAKWIKAPDRMLAEKDPVALELRARYKEVTMPNLGLSDRDVETLLEHLDTASERAAKSMRAAGGRARR